MTMRVAILTVSDRASAGTRADTSGAAIAEVIAATGGEVVARAIVPDERDQIAAQLRAWSDVGNGGNTIDLVLTTGGTGIAVRDVTPEATLDVAERTVPGISEAMRAEGLRHAQRAMLSRSVAAIRGHTLIVNLPGSERGVRESLAAISDVLPHAIELLRGNTEHN